MKTNGLMFVGLAAMGMLLGCTSGVDLQEETPWQIKVVYEQRPVAEVHVVIHRPLGSQWEAVLEGVTNKDGIAFMQPVPTIDPPQADDCLLYTSECEDVVQHFLSTKRGPDYLFATTAAMMLRARGFPTRLVTGFYADPKDFEYATGQTVIRKDDLHTWLQVSLDGVHWISVEATPGYLNPIEDLSFIEWAELGFWEFCRWIWFHPIPVALFMAGIAWGVWSRIWIFETCLTLWVAVVASMGTLRSRTLWLIWLLQWRGRLYGKPRPNHKTLRRWLCESSTDTSFVRNFIPQLERLLYAPAQTISHEPDQEFQKNFRLLLWERKLFVNSSKQNT